MIRFLRHTLCLLLLLTFAACEKEKGPGYNPPATADQTVLLYMPGRDLIYFYRQNIEGICKAISKQIPGNGRMLICYQPDNYSSAVMQEIYYDTAKNRCETITLKNYDQFNAGVAANVQQLFADAAALAPAQRYGLIIGCHGKAWVPASSGVIPYSLRAESGTDPWAAVPGAKPTRSFGDLNYELDIPELAAILGSLSHRFDYLIFDDCFMANIETLYDLRESVDYVIASPCEIMAAGFPYSRVIPHLFAGNGVLNGLEKSCWEFWNFYQNDWETIAGNDQSGCISLAVMSELNSFAAVMQRINAAGKQAFDVNTLQTYKGGQTPLFYDLGHYVLQSCGDQALIGDFTKQLDKAFPTNCRLHTPKFYSKYNDRQNPVFFYTGVSTSEPSKTYATENQQTNWYQTTH